MRLPLRPILAARLGLVGASWAAIVGCSSDHDLLAHKPDTGAADDGASSYGNAGGSATLPPDTGRPGQGGADPEPPGPWTLTWVNGVVDEDATRICFVPIIDGVEVPPATVPFPSADGLPFGGTLVLGSLAHVDLAMNDLHPYLVPKSAGFDPTATCAALLATRAGDAADSGDAKGAGPLSLPVIPAGAISDPRSYLAVATGCARAWPVGDGGSAGEDGADAADSADAGASVMAGPASDTICGPNAGSANAGLVLVRLSRLSVAPQLGFQVVHASAATPGALLVFDQPLTGNTLFTLGKLALGQIAPAHEAKVVAKADLLSNAGKASVRIAPSGSSGFPTVGADLSDILAQSGLDDQSLGEGAIFTFVLIGARPGNTPDSPYYPFDAVLVPNVPTASGED